MADHKPTDAPLDEIELAKEQQQETAVPNGYHDVSDEYPAKKRKKVLLKMDIRILPLLMILYREWFLTNTLSRETQVQSHTNKKPGSALLHRQSQHWKRKD